VRFISAIRLVRRSLRDTGQRLVGGNRAGAGRSAPAIRTEPAWLVAACRGTRFVSLAAAVLFGSMVVANAACDVTTGSTTGATITFTAVGNSVGLCVTNDTVLWGLYGASNGANPNIDAFNNFAMTAGGLALTNLSYATSKATYTLVPVTTSNIEVPEYDITVNSVTGGGSIRSRSGTPARARLATNAALPRNSRIHPSQSP
jgi:hypothetical protein